VQSVEKIEGEPTENLQVIFENGDRENFGKILFATGRRPNVEHLDLSLIGVQLSDDGGIVIDQNFRTSVENVYALGDVTHRIQLTPVAIAEAMVLVNQLYGDGTARMDYQNI